MGQYGGSPLDWNTSTASTFAPSPKEARGEEGQLHIRIPPQRVRNTGTYTSPQGPTGTWAEYDGGTAGRQFGAPARSLPTQTGQRPLMRRRVHAASIPTSEPHSPNGREWKHQSGDRARTARRERFRGDEKARGTSEGRSGRACPHPSRRGRRRPGLCRRATIKPQGFRREPTHRRQHGSLVPRTRTNEALFGIPEPDDTSQQHRSSHPRTPLRHSARDADAEAPAAEPPRRQSLEDSAKSPRMDTSTAILCHAADKRSSAWNPRARRYVPTASPHPTA